MFCEAPFTRRIRRLLKCATRRQSPSLPICRLSKLTLHPKIYRDRIVAQRLARRSIAWSQTTALLTIGIASSSRIPRTWCVNMLKDSILGKGLVCWILSAALAPRSLNARNLA